MKSISSSASFPSVITIQKGLINGKPAFSRICEEWPHSNIISFTGAAFSEGVVRGYDFGMILASHNKDDRAKQFAGLFPKLWPAYSDDPIGIGYLNVLRSILSVQIGIVHGYYIHEDRSENEISLICSGFEREAEKLARWLGVASNTLDSSNRVNQIINADRSLCDARHNGDDSDISRNALFGRMIGRGNRSAKAIRYFEERGETVEAIDNIPDLTEKIEAESVDFWKKFPFLHILNQIIKEKIDVETAINLINTRRDEWLKGD